ncbi:hypothetical protein FRC02_007294 [Tulasnella sp. 418]|nr:hypothetical protein FRC02_007294 [Tulasnella sp. 418]
MSDPLNPSALLETLPTLLPSDDGVIASPMDALAALLHTAMIALGFRLVAIDESSPTQEYPDGVLPSGWKRSSPDSYSLRYRHEQSSLVFLLKIVKLGNRALVHGIALESDKTTTVDVLTSDYFSASFFPYERGSSINPLQEGYISLTRVKDLIALYKVNILQKLIPGLQKEGYEENPENANVPEASRNPQRQAPPRGEPPFNLPPQRREDYYDPLRIPQVGRSDLDPIPRNPFQPPPLFGGDEGDGMFVGPNHPLFRDRREPGGARGPWGGDGYLPPMGAPPEVVVAHSEEDLLAVSQAVVVEPQDLITMISLPQVL